MTFNNIPVNGWPQIKGIENLDQIPDVVADISALETIVGDSSSGLVKDVSDLKTAVGDSSSGLVKDITDINTLLNPSAYTTDGLSFTKCTLDRGGYYRLGNIVIVALRVNISEGGASITGFPNYGAVTNNNNMVIAAAYNYSAAAVSFASLNYQGALSLDPTLSTGSIGVNFVYLANAPETREEGPLEIDPDAKGVKRTSKKS